MKLRSVECPNTIELIGPVISSEQVECARSSAQLLSKTHAQIEKMLEDAKRHVYSIEEQARNTIVERESESIVEVLDQLSNFVDEQRQSLEQLAIDVCKAAIRKLGVGMPPNEKLVGSISKLIDEISPAIPMKLHVAHGLVEQAQLILEQGAEKHKKAIHNITIFEDGSLSQGDAALVTPTGARIQCKFDVMVEKIISCVVI